MVNGSPSAKPETGHQLRLAERANKGYGFTSSGTPNRAVEEHREHIRVFLAMIDPNTAYIGDD